MNRIHDRLIFHNFSRSPLKKLMESLSSLKGNGLDLSAYRQQLENDRNSRSLVYRRSNRPTIAGFLSKTGSLNNRNSALISQQYPLLNPTVSVPILEGNDISKINEFCSNVIACHNAGSKRSLNELSNSEPLVIAMIGALSNSFPKTLLISLMSVIAILFPLNSELYETYVDNDLLFTLLSFLSEITPEELSTSLESQNLVGGAIELIGVLSDSSLYARNSVLCLGLHLILIDIAKSEVTQPLTYASCHCLQRVFGRPEKIDSEVTQSLIQPLSTLLSISNHSAICAILTSFYSLTSKCPSLIFDFYEGEEPYSDIIVHMLTEEDLAQAALPLIGSLCNAHAPQVQRMLSLGLFDILMQLIQTNLIADVFWVLTNLIEAIPSVMIQMITPNFIDSAISTASESSFDVKKEIIYFLCTLVLFLKPEDLTIFTQPHVIDSLVDMLGCGVGMIVLRCLDVFQIFIINIGRGTLSKDFVEVLADENVIEQLESMVDMKLPIVAPRANYILSMIQQLTQSD